MGHGVHDVLTALEAIRRGAYDYILKPFERTNSTWACGDARTSPLEAGKPEYQRNLEELVDSARPN